MLQPSHENEGAQREVVALPAALTSGASFCISRRSLMRRSVAAFCVPPILRNELATAGAGSICLDWFRKKKLNTELNYGAAASSSHKKLLRDALVARRAVVLASVNRTTPDRRCHAACCHSLQACSKNHPTLLGVLIFQNQFVLFFLFSLLKWCDY